MAEQVAAALEARFASLMTLFEQSQNSVRQEYLSLAQAANYTGLSIKHIRRAIRNGDLLCANTGTGKRPKYSISLAHIATWMEAKRLKQGPSKAARQALVEEIFPMHRKKRPAKKETPRNEAGHSKNLTPSSALLAQVVPVPGASSVPPSLLA